MISILVLIYIGISFHTFAEKFNKKKWVYIILGIVVFLASGFLAGVILGIICVFINYNIGNINAFLLELIGIGIGFLSCYLLRLYLSKSWSSNVILVSDDILDDIQLD